MKCLKNKQKLNHKLVDMNIDKLFYNFWMKSFLIMIHKLEVKAEITD